MKRIANYHTHCKLCHHAEGEIIDYIERAITLGYEVIGMSDHGPLKEEFAETMHSRRMTIDDYHNLYLPALEEAIKQCGKRIKILKAVEIEYVDSDLTYYDEFEKELDYLILGQHFVKLDDHYESVYSPISVEALYLHASQIEEALATHKFKILAHPDLFLWSYRKWNEHAKAVSERIIKACIKNNVLIELNCNGIRLCTKKSHFMWLPEEPEEYCYPNKSFWRLAASFNCKVVINDDAHDPNHLHDDATLEAYDLAKELGLDVIDLIEF